MNKIIILLLTAISLNGCSSLRDATTPEEDNHLSGAGSLIVNKNDEPIGLINLEELKKQYGFMDDSLIIDGKTIKYADFPGGKVNDRGILFRRNNLQQYIIAISNQKCSAYIRTLSNSRAQTKMGWTSLSLVLSGAATVFTPASTVRALAASSTAATGLNNVYNESYFNKLATNIISAGIEKKRTEILNNIKSHRSEDLINYPLNEAIADAVDYHSACSMISGMKAASESITETSTASTANHAD